MVTLGCLLTRPVLGSPVLSPSTEHTASLERSMLGVDNVVKPSCCPSAMTQSAICSARGSGLTPSNTAIAVNVAVYFSERESAGTSIWSAGLMI